MTAVERVLEYTDLKREPLNEGTRKPPPDWPSTGEIIFQNVSYSYDANLPTVLNDLKFKIYTGEKIGIVGRTGAGKSSIIQTLFRMAEPYGNIIIDGINIKELSLHDLRSKLSIIPVKERSFLRINLKEQKTWIKKFTARTNVVYWHDSFKFRSTERIFGWGFVVLVRKGTINLEFILKDLWMGDLLAFSAFTRYNSKRLWKRWRKDLKVKFIKRVATLV
jgi:ABC-type multidrug transport system fused ATPase/permease subunit